MKLYYSKYVVGVNTIYYRCGGNWKEKAFCVVETSTPLPLHCPNAVLVSVLH